MRVAVIGAGPAGLAAADALCRSGARVEVFERAGAVGGLARTVTRWSRPVDVGTHIVAGGDAEAAALVRELMGEDAVEVPLRRGIQLKHAVIGYPVRARDLAIGLPIPVLSRAALGALRALGRRAGDEPESAEGWFSARYGEPLYDALLRSFVEKLWGRPGSDIDASFVRPLESTRRQARPAVRSFWYPRQGVGALCEALARRVSAAGSIHFNAGVERISIEDGRVRGLVVDGREHPVDRVLSTIPLASLVRLCGPAPSDVEASLGQLATRHVIVVHLLVTSPRVLLYAWVFVSDPRLAIGRVSDWRHWHPGTTDTETVVTLEYWCGASDAPWTESDDRLSMRARDELASTGLFPDARFHDAAVVRLPHALPVPTIGYRRHVEAVSRHLAGVEGLVHFGRHGTFSHDSVIDSMATGLRAARDASASVRGRQPRHCRGES